MSLKVSFVGLGSMGTPMAMNLLNHGVDLSVYNRTKEKALPLIHGGAKFLEEPSDAFKNSSIVFSMLANDKALFEVVEGENGLLKSGHEGCIHVSLSTVSPEIIKELAIQHKKKGVELVTAPVFGRPDAAAKHELWICMAGEQTAKEKVKPLLEMLGKKVYDFGPTPERANLIKITGNFMILSVIETLSEAFALVKNNEIDPKLFLSFITETLFPAPPYENYGKIILEKKFSPASFKMLLGFKDLKLFLSASEKASLNSPLAELLKARFLESIEKSREEMDWSAISLLAEEKDPSANDKF